MRLRSFIIETWGCQMNHHDSERLEDALRREGLVRAPAVDCADLVLLNTCSVREKPVQKILTRVGQLSRLETPPAIAVCGCVAQQEAERLLAQSPAVRLVLGPRRIHELASALESVKRGKRPVMTGFSNPSPPDPHTGFRHSLGRAMVTVTEGCSEFCTFCVVPYTRGKESSRPAEAILREVRHLLEQGVPEVELLGQTINSYRCPVTGADFPSLLDRVASLPGLCRLRFITSHPRYFDDHLIHVMTRHPNLSRYLHLPFQAGSDKILRSMRRRYTRREYLDLITRIREHVPGVNLSTDVIVGFPGESEEDFLQTLDILKKVRFGQVYAFAYSPRPGTPAARYDDPVPETIQKDRLHRLFELADTITAELNQAQVGTLQEVLIEGPSRRSEDHWQGRTADNRVVNFPKVGHEQPGNLVNVRISRASAHSLGGDQSDEIPSTVTLPVHSESNRQNKKSFRSID